MPSKKKKYNARFPPARIKKIMQMDEEVGKVAATVPVIISRALELFIESLIMQASQTTLSRNAKTLSTSHIKQAIESEEKYSFLRELVAAVPDHQTEEDGSNSGCVTAGSSGTADFSAQGNSVKRPRGRPRKPRDASCAVQKKERRKRAKKESSESSASEDSEGTDDAEEYGDSEGEPNGSNNNMATAATSIPTMPHSAAGLGMWHPGPPASTAFPGLPHPSMYPPGVPMYPGLPGGVLNPVASWPPSGPQLPGTSHAAPAMMRAISHNQEDDDYDT